MGRSMGRSNRSCGQTCTGRAFSLVELLVVLTIITIVIGVLIPSLRAARSSARTVATQAIIKDLSSASQRFKIDNKRNPGYFSPVEMGAGTNQSAGFSQMQNLLLDLAGGVTSSNGPGILRDVGPGATTVVNVDLGLIGATNNAPSNPVNLGSTGGYFSPDKRNLELIAGRESTGDNLRMPDMIDAFGQPILAWSADTRKGTRFAAENSDGEDAARFYWASNATYLSSDALGRDAKRQRDDGDENTGSLIGSDTGGSGLGRFVITGGGANGALAVLLANPAFLNTTTVPPTPGEPRGTLVFHSGGRDGVYLNNLDSGARKWRDGVNGIGLPLDGTDPIRDFDDVVQAANN